MENETSKEMDSTDFFKEISEPKTKPTRDIKLVGKTVIIKEGGRYAFLPIFR